ncbi:MAG: hypothetical protein Kow0060_24510 [Methylohalobius crimeensis]
MNATYPEKLLSKVALFNLLKYSIYVLLIYDAYRYLQMDSASARQILADGVTYHKFVETYAITIDMISWLVLLFCFELETALIPPDQLKGTVLWGLHGLRVVCYFFVLSSYYGYIAKYLMLTQAVPFTVGDVCTLTGTAYTYLQELDEYLPFTAASCEQLRNLSWVRIEDTHILADPARLQEARWMALVDVIYATTWLLVVVILELDVYLMERDRLKGWLLRVSEFTKAGLYLILLAGAIFWGIRGEFLDFWDAFLWLAAFALIDLNVFGLADEAVPA